MSDNSNIECTDATWNVVRGCTKVSAGCDNSYAMGIAHRFSGAGLAYEGLTRKIAGRGQWNGKVKLAPELLTLPFTWVKPRRVFVNSMSDLFHPSVPFEFIADVFAVMSVSTRHTYQILTKRPERMRQFLREYLVNYEGINYDQWLDECCPGDDFDPDNISAPNIYPEWKALGIGPGGGYDNCGPVFPYENVHLGVSVEDQQTANKRIPDLLECPAAIRFLSCEPLLGPVDLTNVCVQADRHGEEYQNCLSLEDWVDYPESQEVINSVGSGALIDWVIAGGESGPGARPANPDWFRALRDQCVAYSVPFFFKQWGEYIPVECTADNPFGWYPLDGGDGSRFDDIDKEKCELDIVGMNLVCKVGKKLAGRMLDGREWNQMPDVVDIDA